MKHARNDYNDFVALDKKIPKNEPVLLIRGQDIMAPMVLEFYATQAEAIGVDAKLVQLVRGQAEAMRDWQQRVKVKKPDLPS